MSKTSTDTTATKYNVLIKVHNIDVHGNINVTWEKMRPKGGTAYRFTQEEAQKYTKTYQTLGYGEYVRIARCES